MQVNHWQQGSCLASSQERKKQKGCSTGGSYFESNDVVLRVHQRSLHGTFGGNRFTTLNVFGCRVLVRHTTAPVVSNKCNIAKQDYIFFWKANESATTKGSAAYGKGSYRMQSAAYSKKDQRSRDAERLSFHGTLVHCIVVVHIHHNHLQKSASSNTTNVEISLARKLTLGRSAKALHLSHLISKTLRHFQWKIWYKCRSTGQRAICT